MTLETIPETQSKPSLNLAIVLGLVATNLALYLVLPLYLIPLSDAWILLLVPIITTTVAHWAMVHEAIHGKLLPDRRRNDRVGRVISILFGAPFDVVRFGHLSHHSLNAKATERPEIYDPAKDNYFCFSAVYYLRLCFGVYVAEIFSAILAWLPRRYLELVVRRAFYEGHPEAETMADRAVRVILNPQTLYAIRIEGLLIVTLNIGALVLYGPWWPAFLLALVGRAFFVSFMDNAPHYAAELGNSDQGYNMRLAWPWRLAVLNSNLHGTHHRHPTLPWTALPAAFSADHARYDGNYLMVPLRQLLGPVAIQRLKQRTTTGGASTFEDNRASSEGVS